MSIFQGLNCLAPQESPQRWLEDLTICILLAEDLVMEANNPKKSTTTTPPSKPPRFYVEVWIQGQKLRMNQKTDERVPSTKTGEGYCVEWFNPMKFKVCIQSLLQSQSPTLEFRVFQVNEIDRKLVDKEFGVASFCLKTLYDLGQPNSLVRLTITPKFGRSSKGFLCISKEINSIEEKKEIKFLEGKKEINFIKEKKEINSIKEKKEINFLEKIKEMINSKII